MRGLNTTATVRHKAAEQWSNAYTDLRGRFEDIRAVEKDDPEVRGTTDYTHIFFCDYKKSGSPVVIKRNGIMWDNKFPTVKYRVRSAVDAAGAQHHWEIRLARIDKE